jgi:ABC-type lipoprotein export system ATPase subunit
MGKSDKKDKNIKNTAEEAKDMQESVAEGSAESMSAITSDMANEATDNDLISGENAPMVLAENLVKIYKTSELEVLALQGLDLRVERGELTAIIGNSGSGKSTFLNMLGGLDEPSAGKLFVDGKNLFKLTAKEKVLYKRDTVGFVWQNNGRNLLPFMNAMENIMTPMHLTSEKNKKERALELLDLVGMSHRKFSRMNQLSGGEQQRIAIAIALANKPKLLLADEPTGSVDRKTADYIFDLFKRLNQEMGQTIIIVTHDVELSKKVARVVAIRDGKISSERILKEHYSNLGNGEINWMEEETQDEYSIVDRAGRIQIPRNMLDSLELKGNKIKVTCEDKTIMLHNPDEEQ